jgi:hypothetical protein
MNRTRRAALAAWMCLYSPACFGGDVVSPKDSNPPAPAAFTCADAPRLLGHPTHTVQSCFEMPPLRGLYEVVLTHATEPGVGLIVVTNAQGEVETARGPAAAAAWLRRTGALAEPGITLAHVMMVLKAFEALPTPLTLAAQVFDRPGIGKASFSAQPLRVELYEDITPDGPPGDGRFVRGVLAPGADGKWVWTLEERGSGGVWTPRGTVAGE